MNHHTLSFPSPAFSPPSLRGPPYLLTLTWLRWRDSGIRQGTLYRAECGLSRSAVPLTGQRSILSSAVVLLGFSYAPIRVLCFFLFFFYYTFIVFFIILVCVLGFFRPLPPSKGVGGRNFPLTGLSPFDFHLPCISRAWPLTRVCEMTLPVYFRRFS